MTTIYPTPVMHENSLDYMKPDSYMAEVTRESSMKLTTIHLLDKNNLVAEYILANTAFFFTTVVVNRVFYRKTFMADFNQHNEQDAKLVVRQVIELPNFSCNPSIFIHPGVANYNTSRSKTWNENTGIENISDSENYKFVFPSYCLLASGGWFKHHDLQALFKICPNDEITNGQFMTAIFEDHNQLQIKITMHSQMADAISADKDSRSRAQVVCTALTQALQELKTKYDINPKDAIFEKTSDLQQWLLSETDSSWEDNNFNPSLVSSKLWCERLFPNTEI